MIKVNRLKTLKLIKSKKLNNASKEINTLSTEIKKSYALIDKLLAIKDNENAINKVNNAWNIKHKQDYNIKIIQQLDICKNRIIFLERELKLAKNKLGALILQKKNIDEKIKIVTNHNIKIIEDKIEKNTPNFRNS